MITSSVVVEVPAALAASLTGDTLLTVDLANGGHYRRSLWRTSSPCATPKERNHRHVISCGSGIHGGGLDEDISVKGPISRHSSGESQNSFERCLAMKGKAMTPSLTP